MIHVAICILLLTGSGLTRYLFHNVYGDASALTADIPKDVIAVPFGWTAAAEANRNSILASLGVQISALPALVYTKAGGAKAELRVFDQSTKPWSWTNVNTAIAGSFSVSLIGDSIIANMASVQSGLASPFTTAQNLGVSGNTVAQIQARVGNISASATHVIIEGGTNDLVGLGDGKNIIPGYTLMLNALTTKKVIVAGIPQVDEAQLDASHPGWKTYLNNTLIADYNAQLVALCGTYSNCTPATGLMNMSMVGKTSDGIHPVSGAYPEFVSKLMPIL